MAMVRRRVYTDNLLTWHVVKLALTCILAIALGVGLEGCSQERGSEAASDGVAAAGAASASAVLGDAASASAASGDAASSDAASASAASASAPSAGAASSDAESVGGPSAGAASVGVAPASAPSAGAASANTSSDGAPLKSTSSESASAVSTAPAPDAEVADVATVAYLGPEGTYTQEAAKLFFGDNDELLPQDTVADALALVVDGTAAYAVVPQENTLGGPVTEYIDAFLDADGVSVVGEVVLPIRQTLMGLPGTDLSKVKRVLSHKQGLAQSSAWLDQNLPDAAREEAASTAAAAQEVAEGKDPTTVAIAAPGAAELYKLEVLQDNVSQSQANRTRFYVVATHANKLPGYECAVFAASISAADLPGVLDAACTEDTQLVCVHDRPEGSALGTYRYVIELSRKAGFTDGEIARLGTEAGLEYLGRYSRVEG